MPKAAEYPIPHTELDKIIARLTLKHACDLMALGASPQDAATQACHGAWSDWGSWVCAVLSGEKTDVRAIISPEEAARMLARCYRGHARAEALRRGTSGAAATFWREVACLL